MERLTGCWARGKVGKLGRLHSGGSSVFAQLAARNGQVAVAKGLTDFGSAQKRSDSF